MESAKGSPDNINRRKFLKGIAIGTAAGFVGGMNIFGGRNAERTAGIESSNELLDDGEAFNRLMESFRDEDIKQISEFRPPAQKFGELVDVRCANFDSAVVSRETVKRVNKEARDWFAKFAHSNPNFTQNDLKSAMKNVTNQLWRKQGVEIAPR